jgi:hypothetical protein
MPFSTEIPYLLWGPDFSRESVQFVNKDENNRVYYFNGENGPVEPSGIPATNLRQMTRVPTPAELASPTLWYITVSDEDAEQPFNPHNIEQTMPYYEDVNEVTMIGGSKRKARKSRKLRKAKKTRKVRK